MDVLFNVEYYSTFSVIGLFWSLLTYWLMFSKRGQGLLSNPWSIVVTACAMIPSIWYVTEQVGMLTKLSGGIPPLDVQFGYGKSEIYTFADALGAEGRMTYAVFQLGADALAPPAFVCFLMSVFRSTVKRQIPLRICAILAFIYFTSVLLANTLMPVIIMHYPEDSGPLLTALYSSVPVMDWLKYSAHALTWIVIFLTWIVQGAGWLKSRA